MDELNDQERRAIKEGLAQARRANPRLFRRPVLPASVLRYGSLMGFSDDVAEVILRDHDCQVYLNELWTIYSRETGLELPPGMQKVIDKERSGSGSRLNLEVVHSAGWGWSDDDTFDAMLEQWMAAQPYSDQVRVLVGTAGTRGAKGAEKAESGDSTPWETYFLTKHFLVLLRRKDGQLVGQVESATVSGPFKLTLEWPDAVCRDALVRVVRGQREPRPFILTDVPDGLPTRASIQASLDKDR